MYAWELEAVISGLQLRQLDTRELLAVHAFNMRYVSNAKRPKLNKVINKPREERKILHLFDNQTQQDDVAVENKRKAIEIQKRFSQRRRKYQRKEE
ncbi:hypothetical protein K1728_02015 [Weissella confusa]|uniref:hypothetical protein n=1 Tax=Weissella confusa TaxID=1583 RepID=UPI001C6F9040|nr:hypothetical protein [Weissella confusa]QYU58212.1 hypothetical protein K1728_02015 [Weissella confusa]